MRALFGDELVEEFSQRFALFGVQRAREQVFMFRNDTARVFEQLQALLRDEQLIPAPIAVRDDTTDETLRDALCHLLTGRRPLGSEERGQLDLTQPGKLREQCRCADQ